MSSDRFCDGCEELDYLPQLNPYDFFHARCNDPKKPVTGKHRVLDASGIGKPFGILRPAWCRGKKEPTP